MADTANHANGNEGAVDVAMQGLRQLLQEEKGDVSSAAAVKLCQVLHRSVQQLLQIVEQCKSRGNVGGTEVIRELSGQLCSCFSTSSAVLTLCKDIEAGSSWLFEELSFYLAALFKTTFTLIKVSTELLDLLTLDHDTLETVVSSLRLLCAPVMHFDPSLLVLVWRGVGRMVCKGKSVLGDEWSIQPITSDICIAMETKAVECVQCAPTQTESDVGTDGGGGTGYVKLLKLCRFLSSLLVKLVQEFHSSSVEFAADLTNLLVHLYSCIPPSPHCKPVSSSTQAELESNILLVCEPVITALLDCSVFLKCLLSPDTTTSRGEGSGFGRLMCLCVLLKSYPKLSEGVQDFVMEPVSSRENQSESCLLLDAVFTSVSQCSVELQLPVRVPGVMCNGQPQRAVSLSEHLLTHFCSFIACLPHRHFSRVEGVLFRQVFSDGATPSSLLAADVLTFIARCEERLAEGYANLLSQLLQSSPVLSSHACWTARVVLRRMVSLLLPPHQALFTQAHPPSSPSQLSLWAHLDLTVIDKPLQAEVVHQLATTSIELVTTQLQSGHLELPSLHWALRCLHSSHSLLPPSHHHSSTITTVTQMWDWIMKQNVHNKWGAVALCDGLVMTADNLSHLPPQTLLKVFNSLRDLITGAIPTTVCLAVAEFLMQCAGLKVPGNLQNPILRNLVFIFQHLLCHSSWLVLHSTLLAFRHFAECTPYVSAVEECVVPSLNDSVVDFLQCSPYLASSRPELSQQSFWVWELHRREERVVRWREGGQEAEGSWEERRNGDTGTQQHQALVASKVQLLVETWHELCTLTLTPDTCLQLRDLCTSIQSHISHCSSLSPMQQ